MSDNYIPFEERKRILESYYEDVKPGDYNEQYSFSAEQIASSDWMEAFGADLIKDAAEAYRQVHRGYVGRFPSMQMAKELVEALSLIYGEHFEVVIMGVLAATIRKEAFPDTDTAFEKITKEY